MIKVIITFAITGLLAGAVTGLAGCDDEDFADAPHGDMSCNADETPAKCGNGYLYHCEDGKWVRVRDCWGEGLHCFVNCPIRGIGSDGGCAE